VEAAVAVAGGVEEVEAAAAEVELGEAELGSRDPSSSSALVRSLRPSSFVSAIFDLDFDAILAAMYAVSISAEGDCYVCVPPDPGIEAAALGASESAAPGASESAAPGASASALSGTASAQVFHTFTLDSGASCSFFRDRTTLTPLSRPVAVSLADPSGGPVLARYSTVLPCPAAPSGSLSGLYLPSFSTNLMSGADLQDAGVDQFTPAGQRVTHCMCTQTGCHLATFTRRPGSSLYTLTTESPPVAASGQVAASSQVFAAASRSGGEFSSDLLRAFCRAEGIRQTFSLPASPQQNGIAERRIGMVMDVARTSMIHAAAPHFLWPFAVQYAAHQINLQPRVSLPETSPTLRWTGKVDDASAFRVWGSRAFVRDLSADKLSSRAVPCIFLGFPPDAPSWQFYHPTSRRVLSSQDVTFDESVLYYRLFPYRTAPLPPPAALPRARSPPVDPLPPQGPAPSGVSQVDEVEPVKVAAYSGASGVLRYAEPERAESGGAEPGGAEPEGAGSGGAEPERAEPGVLLLGVLSLGLLGFGVWSLRVLDLAVLWVRCPAGGAAGAGGSVAPGGPGSGGAARAGAGGSASAGGAARAGGAAGVGAAGGTGAGAGVPPGGPAGAGAAGGTEAGGAAGVGADAEGTGVVPAGPVGAVRPRPYFFPLLEQLASPLPAPSPYAGPTGGLAERREPNSRPASPVRTARTSCRVPRPRPPALPGTHSMALRPSTAPQRVPLPSPPESSLPVLADPVSDSLCAASPTVTRLLATVVTDPSFESTAASALATELVDFAAHCRLDYAASLVAQSASVCPPSVGGRPGCTRHPDPRSYAEAIEGPYSSQWQAAMDAEMAPWKSTGTYVDEVPPPGANIRQGVDYFQTFSPTPKMTTLWVLLHVAAQRDYELHSLDFSTAFLQGSLHEEIWLRHPPGFTGSFPPGTQWSLRRPVYGLRQAPREWHDTLRTTLAALGFAPSTADPSLFLRTDTSLPPFYILVYVDDLVFATADTAGLAHVKSDLQKRHTCTDVGELRSYLGLQITRDRARRTITLTQSHMVQQVLQRFDFTYSSPQATPLSTRHSLSALPSDESVEPSGLYPELVGCLMYLLTCTRPDLAYPLSILTRYVAPGRHRREHMAAAKRVLRYLCSTSGLGLVLGRRSPVVLTGHADASWVDDLATQRLSQGYTFSLGSGAVSWRSTLFCSRLQLQPRSPPILYVDNKAMLALCREYRLEHRKKHIALRYFLARELQQRGQLRLAYVASQANTADIFTKALQPCDHQRFCTMLGLVPTWPHLLTS
ncbi:unnamed protein product, partial [Closterium sp. NIES-54]